MAPVNIKGQTCTPRESPASSPNGAVLVVTVGARAGDAVGVSDTVGFADVGLLGPDGGDGKLAKSANSLGLEKQEIYNLSHVIVW